MSNRPLPLQPFLSRLLSHSRLTREERDRLLSLQYREREIPGEYDIVRPGEAITYSCFVAKGLVAGFNQAPDGKRQITALYIPGEMPDLLAAAHPEVTSGLQAITQTTVLQVTHDDLRALAAECPGLAEAFWRNCAVEVSIMRQWLASMGRRTSLARVAHFLCEMAWRSHAREGNAARYRLPLTQTHLAQIAGISPVHVNRTLMALRGLGTTIRAKVVSIEDWNALASVADFEASYLQTRLEPDCPQRMAA